MKLTVLGCSGTFPGPDSPCSSYLVEAEGFRLMVDAGNGSLGTLQSVCDLLAVDAVLLSHLHADHCLDLTSYYYARRYHPAGPPPPLPLYGPHGTQERLCKTFERRPDDAMAKVYDFRTVGPGRLEIGPFRIDLTRVAHPVEAYGVRLAAGGRSMTYSGDTGRCEGLVRLARDSDLFLCEASWLDTPTNPPGVHMSGREAGQHAHDAGVGRLVLTHIVPWGDKAASLAEAAEGFTGPIDLAKPRRSFEL